MNVFDFNSYQEFGLFFKINSKAMLELSSDVVFHSKVAEFIQVYDHAKGGCGCSIAKRQRVASEQYVLFVPDFFSGFGDTTLSAALVLKTKELLNSPSVIRFKKEDSDLQPFFSI